MPPPLRDLASSLALETRADDEAVVVGERETITAAELRALSTAGVSVEAVVALRLHDPLRFIRSIVLLDGQVSGLLLLTPDLPSETTAKLMVSAASEILIDDANSIAMGGQRVAIDTRWFMTTSGTTGTPKIVMHRLSMLARSVKPARRGVTTVWGLLYEPSRFAGLQVVLQALLGGGKLIVPDPAAELSARITFLANEGCTHLSATPSLWRKLLMLPETSSLRLSQITLGGEIADANLLKALARKFPNSRVTHIYASTEVGVGFAVSDGLPGFPVDYLESDHAGVALKVAEGMLWARPPERGEIAAHMRFDDQGFICTNDRVEIEGDRVTYLGRESSTVNIGGTKIQPEAVERTVAEHPKVSECVVRAKPNPILGAVLTLTVVPRDPTEDVAALKADIKAWCRERLQREAQPATITVANEIATTAAGKIARA